MPLSNFSPGECLTASEEKISHIGSLCRVRPITGERISGIRGPEREISETEQTLATDRVGLEHRDSRQEGGSNSRRFRREDSHRRAQ